MKEIVEKTTKKEVSFWYA